MDQSFPSPKEVMALLKGRRSVRRYQPDPVPEELVKKILEAGRWAPSASNRQPWEFIVIQDKGMRWQVAQYAAYYFVRWAHVEEAPLIIALCGDTRNKIYRQFLHEDVGLAGGQMMLEAAALGLGSCWIGGFDRTAISRLLNLPDNLEPIALITFGFPADVPEPPDRKPLSHIVHYERYGNRKAGAKIEPPKMPSTGLLGMLVRWLRVKFRP